MIDTMTAQDAIRNLYRLSKGERQFVLEVANQYEDVGERDPLECIRFGFRALRTWQEKIDGGEAE